MNVQKIRTMTSVEMNVVAKLIAKQWEHNHSFGKLWQHGNQDP